MNIRFVSSQGSAVEGKIIELEEDWIGIEKPGGSTYHTSFVISPKEYRAEYPTGARVYKTILPNTVLFEIQGDHHTVVSIIEVPVTDVQTIKRITQVFADLMNY